MEKQTLLYYVTHSKNQGELIDLGVYIDTKSILKHYKLKNVDELKGLVDTISSEEVENLIEKYGCRGIEVY
ncbi:hypothetical protein [Enterococcus mundtii]|uniref:hypothetical protein n=1 Tax=Enterococcus mundtii TaxID=53346 RepID=UPI001A97416D|nr:hypothetical protein [Enterococcus mundtii]MBO1087146.1 hypothetical protein [Enterococcus mundtii]